MWIILPSPFAVRKPVSRKVRWPACNCRGSKWHSRNGPGYRARPCGQSMLLFGTQVRKGFSRCQQKTPITNRYQGQLKRQYASQKHTWPRILFYLQENKRRNTRRENVVGIWETSNYTFPVFTSTCKQCNRHSIEHVKNWKSLETNTSSDSSIILGRETYIVIHVRLIRLQSICQN